MIYLQITNNKKEIIFDNIPNKYIAIFQNEKNSKHEHSLRSFYKQSESTNIWMVSKDKDLYKSSKIFNKTFDLYEDLITSFYNNYSINLLSNIHTISTIQAKMSQKIEPFIKGAETGKQEDRIQTVINTLSKSDDRKSADLICHLSKRIKELNIHLESLKVLTNKTITDLENRTLKSVLLEIYELFKDRFSEKNITINFERVDGTSQMQMDYKIFNLVMHHFFDNAVKYSKHNDSIDFIFSTNGELVIKMHSLIIENKDEIFKQGYSGKNAHDLAGDGIGMYVIEQGLNIMNMSIEIKSGEALNNAQGYSRNTFIISTLE